MEPTPGTVIGGRFRISRLLGEGGMGSVYEAEHDVLPRKFAIKILHHNLSRNPTFIERFRREAIAASMVEHPNVIYISDFGKTSSGDVYLVMEYLEGACLDEILVACGRFSLQRTLPILIQVADALDYAHQLKVIHRDLKPENILLTEIRGMRDYVKLLDFGIAKLSHPTYAKKALTVEGQVFGTVEYMSPEQATGEPLDGRSDLYACGCLAYELLTGEPPFLGEPGEIMQAHVRQAPIPPSNKLREHRIPASMDALILRCLAKSPDERYQTGADLKRDLQKVRALLFSQAHAQLKEAPYQNQTPSPISAGALKQGWRRLGDGPKVTAIPFFTAKEEPIVENSESAIQIAALLPHSPPGAPSDQVRDAINDTLRGLGIALLQAGMAPSLTNEILERLLIIEEEVITLSGTIALSEQKFDRVRFEYGQRENNLRYAILDLSMEQARLRGSLAADSNVDSHPGSQLEDLSFQVECLKKRCQETSSECQREIQSLNEEIENYRKAQRAMTTEATELFQELHTQIETLRPRVNTPELKAHYQKLDGLRAKLTERRSQEFA